MNRLTSKKILEENNSDDPSSITVVTIHQRAVSDVSCLKDFKNLEKLDLSFNNLTSLQGLKPCVNLKWLSVVQNKLESLQGIETLLKLTVLNAGKNILKTMDEVRALVSLRALILNDNEIASICKLDQLNDLNTLVLSRNPIGDIGDSLGKLKSITKLSLSNCKLQTIGSSLKSFVNLKEFRLAHNEIKALPAELAHNTKLLNLDLGNNSITRHTDLKVLSSLRYLRNLNLQGNPIADKDKLAEKIKRLVPNLQIFNNRPMEGSKKYESLKMDTKSDLRISGKRGHSQNDDNPFDEGRVLDAKRKVQQKKSKINKVSEKDGSSDTKDDIVPKKENRKRENNGKESKLDPIDDGEIPFSEIISRTVEHLADGNGKKQGREAVQDMKSLGGIVTFPAKRKKASKGICTGGSSLKLLSSSTEVGMGGPSTWDT